MRRFFILVVLILAVVGCTQTEGNWVLWSKDEHTELLLGSAPWEPIEAWEAKAECEKGKAHRIKDLVDINTNPARHNLKELGMTKEEVEEILKDMKVTVREDGTGVEIRYISRGSRSTHEFRCLPETIDPRGPGQE